MNELTTQILIQFAGYTAVLLLAIMFFSFMLKGFFWKFLKVKTSMGRLTLIKRRGQLRDEFLIGEIKEGFLVFKDRKEGKKFINRIACDNNTNKALYRSLGVSWIDIDDENRICKCDYTAIPGFDSKKFSDLFIMAEQQPEIGDNKQMIMLLILGVIVLLCIGAVYFGYTNYDLVKAISLDIPKYCRGVVIPGS